MLGSSGCAILDVGVAEREKIESRASVTGTLVHRDVHGSDRGSPVEVNRHAQMKDTASEAASNRRERRPAIIPPWTGLISVFRYGAVYLDSIMA